MSVLRAFFSLPILPMARNHGWWRNRRSPNSGWLSPNDVAINISDSWHAFINRIPEDSWLHRNQQNQYNGSSYQTGASNCNRNQNPFGPN